MLVLAQWAARWSTVPTGGLAGAATGIASQLVRNALLGAPLGQNVWEMTAAGIVGGMAGGFALSRLPSATGLLPRVLVGAGTNALVGGGMYALTTLGQPSWRQGVIKAAVVNAISGGIGAATDYWADMQAARARPGGADGEWRLRQAQDPAVRRALDVWNDPHATGAQKWAAERVLRESGLPGVWQGGLSLEQQRARLEPEGEGARLLPAGEPTSLAGQPGRLLDAPRQPGLLTAGELPVSFYHGTTAEHLASFRSEGAKAVGGGDFGLGFYTTRRPSEAIGWASNRLGRVGQAPYVIEFQVQAARFRELRGIVGNPYTYEDPLEVFVGIVRHETGHPDLPFDYVYGPVSGHQGWEQFTFKSRPAFDVLNASVMLIHRVLPDGTLELVERIVR